MAKKLPELSKAEWIIMKKVWDLKKTNVREVYEELKASQNWAYNTIRTMMERLREKGYLAVKRIGNSYFYQPLVSQRKIALEALNNFVDKVFDGAVGPVISHLIKNEKLSESEIEAIKKLLEKEEK